MKTVQMFRFMSSPCI